MTANVSVLVAHKEGVLKIANAALRFRPEAAKRGEPGEKKQGNLARGQRPNEGIKSSHSEGKLTGKVWVLSPEGKPKPVSIIIGITNGTFSEVAGGDLQEGTEIIVEETSNKKSGQSGSASPSLRGFR